MDSDALPILFDDFVSRLEPELSTVTGRTNNRLPVLLTWPVPALLVWGGAWMSYALAVSIGAAAPWPMLAACALGVIFSVVGSTRSRQLALALGFPLSLWLSGTHAVPSWAWLAPLALALLVYPVGSWRDAPLFPTPLQALRELSLRAPLPAGAALLDAGCGLGDGLRALRVAYPEARFFGIEASWPLRLMAAVRCRWAKIWQGDIWLEDWRGYDMVYLFQRPETMARAVAKAQAELKPGAWLVSLEFVASSIEPTAVVYASSERPVWMYQQPFKPAAKK